MTTYTPGNPFAPSADPEPFEKATTEPAGDLRAVGDALDEARALTARLVAVLAEARASVVTIDDAVDVTQAAKDAQAHVYAEQTAARAALWDTYGPGKHATETGRTFSFTEPSGSRSCDYGALEKGYPEAYAAVVKRSEPKPGAIGTLRLPKGAAK